jgi:hypothetical protein
MCYSSLTDLVCRGLFYYLRQRVGGKADADDQTMAVTPIETNNKRFFE